MSVDLLIKSARIVSPRAVRDASVAVKDGKVVAIGLPDYMPDADQVIDAGGKYLIPGALDLHVHFRDPGKTYKEDFSTGSQAAAAGGVTTVFDMPNTIPETGTVKAFELKRKIAEEKSYVNYGIYGMIMGGFEEEIEPLIEAGVAGFKWDMGYEPWELATKGLYVPDNRAVLKMLRILAKHGIVVGCHIEDIEIIARLTEDLKEAGRTDYMAHFEARPDTVEVSALLRAMRLSDITGCKLHIHHMTSKRCLDMLKQRRFEGKQVTSEAGPHWFLFSTDDYGRLGGIIRVMPAIKTRKDADAIWEGLRDGSIECYATDHAPHSLAEKLERHWYDASPGAIGVETSMPLMLDKVNKGELTIERYVAIACENPATIYGLYPRKGAIVLGADADLVLLDMDKKWTIKNEEVHSKVKLTPFDGWEVQGMPSMVWVNGHLVAQDRVVVGKPGFGKMVNPKKQW